MTGGQLVDVTDATDGGIGGIGTGKDLMLSEKHTIRATFRNFEDLPQQRGTRIQSATLSCHGHNWRVMIYPRGDANSNKDIVHVSIYLTCFSLSELKAKYRLWVPSSGTCKSVESENIFSASTSLSWGGQNFASRSYVLQRCLVDGNLTVEADIQIYTDGSPVWRPKTTLHRDMLEIFASGKQSGDVKFQVGDIEFSAHRLILEARAPTLAALAEGYPSETPIPIQHVDARIFRQLLCFVYADELPKEELQQRARELLDIADRFGCTGLKLAAEAELATSGITVDTAADMVLLGDAKNCALLKEAAIDFIAADPAPVMVSSGWAKVKESVSLMSELMEAAFSKKRSASGGSEKREYKRMCVSDLRRKLEKRGLDVDGSKEMLVNRLEDEEADGNTDDSSQAN